MIILVAHDLGWINGAADDPRDQCAHGSVELSVGQTRFVTPADGKWNVSGAALYLLRTLSLDHTPTSPVAENNFLFPHCAHSAWTSDGRFRVVCPGCNLGIDVFIEHHADLVTLSRGEHTQIVSERAWKDAVLGFVRQIEDFYGGSSPKALVEDEYERQGWEAFWREWHERVDAAS